ncbi:MAG: phenylalanine--tRNA ligase subunit beta, partial [Planctomycetia bacterium]
MKISYRWLGRHVDLSGISPQRLVEDLTLSTCEVESLTPFLPHLSNIVVGHVLTRAKHPDADKLSVCSVDCGEGTARQIVCGAPNVDAGQMVAVALPGVELPGDFRIKKSKIRGVESDGMICSERELGLGEEHNGIWVLPQALKPGAKLADAMDLSDWVIEIDNKSLTHRPDLWGHRGFAAEIAAMHLRPLKPLETGLPPTGNGPAVPVRIESQACTRYLALRLEGVQARRSPDWLRALLFAVDQRPIDLLVDLSNFVMLDLGQPNHVFDATRLDASGITVRNARAEERFRTLDGVERRLEPSDLLIASGDKAVALAGIMGGEDSKVEAGTQSLLLEVASFHFATVRRTAARLALRTDSSTRFEKNLDPTLPLRAAGHYVRLLAQLEPGLRLPAPLCDAGEWKDPARVIELSCERVRSLLGVELADVHIADILMRLGFGVQGSSGTLYVSVPSARATKDIGI